MNMHIRLFRKAFGNQTDTQRNPLPTQVHGFSFRPPFPKSILLPQDEAGLSCHLDCPGNRRIHILPHGPYLPDSTSLWFLLGLHILDTWPQMPESGWCTPPGKRFARNLPDVRNHIPAFRHKKSLFRPHPGLLHIR